MTDAVTIGFSAYETTGFAASSSRSTCCGGEGKPAGGGWAYHNNFECILTGSCRTVRAFHAHHSICVGVNESLMANEHHARSTVVTARRRGNI